MTGTTTCSDSSTRYTTGGIDTARDKKKETRVSAREYICPYCFSEIDMSKVHYVCSGQSCARNFAAMAMSTRNAEKLKYVSKDGNNEIDPEKTMFYGKAINSNEAVIAKQHIIRGPVAECDVCNRPVYSRVCPICHNPIPPGAEEDGNRIFVILGPKGVGKSHYIAVLIDQLKNVISPEFNGVLSAATDSTTLKYRELYYHRLFEEKRKLPMTTSFESADANREPLIYYLRIFDQDKPKVFTFAFFDTAGEDLTSTEKIMSLNINTFISKAAGLVYLVDPLQSKYINPRINIEGKPKIGPDESDMLNNVCQAIRQSSGSRIRSKDKIDIPIAVCLTKSDVLFKTPENEEEDKVLFGPGSALRIPREHGTFDKENFDQIDVELREYMRRCLGDNFIQVVDGFRQHRFFAFSALGCNPTQSSLPRAVSPSRVEDPFIWLLNNEEI